MFRKISFIFFFKDSPIFSLMCCKLAQYYCHAVRIKDEVREPVYRKLIPEDYPGNNEVEFNLLDLDKEIDSECKNTRDHLALFDSLRSWSSPRLTGYFP